MKPWLVVPAALLLVLVSLAPARAEAKTWRVNVAGTGDAPTIAAAVDSAAVADSILVGPGTYYFTQYVWISWEADGLTLVSESGAGQTILDGSAAPAVFAANADDLVIEGFTFVGGGIYIGGGFEHGHSISNNIFRDIQGLQTAALDFGFHGGMTISANIIYRCGTGLLFSEFACGNVIEGNTIVGCGRAIVLDGNCLSTTVRNNLIVANGSGIDLNGIASGDVSCNNVFGNSSADWLNGTDPTGMNGNISVDPQFCAADPVVSGNFLLQSDSPCAPGNHPDGASCGLIGACPVGCEDVSVERMSWGSIKAMYR
jgi:hypothetical protein